jgi:hypothetical protein
MSDTRVLTCIGGPQHGRIVEVPGHARGMKFPRIDMGPMLSPREPPASIYIDHYVRTQVILHLPPDRRLIAEYLRDEALEQREAEAKFLEHVTRGKLTYRTPLEDC